MKKDFDKVDSQFQNENEAKNDNFLNIKEQIKRQKDKENYDKWMREVCPLAESLEPHLKKYVEAIYHNDFSHTLNFFDIEQEKIVELIADFANTTLTNETLKKRYLDNLYNKNPNLIADIRTDPLPKNLSEAEEKDWETSTVGRTMSKKMPMELTVN